MGSLIEYYITCNPPLLPPGVVEVIDRARNILSDELLEILYEPDVPWFKCISTASSKPAICDTIQSILIEIVEEDVDVIDERDANGRDILITSEDAKVMTWMDHSRGDCISDSFRGEDIYPEVISSLKHKQLWRGLEESHKKASVVTLLAKCKEILGEPAVAESDNCFDNCPISFNMASNLVYIGSNDKDALQAAVAKLHTLVELHDNAGKCTHAIFTNAQGEEQFAYKWLSHLGMQRTTYLAADATAPGDYADLLGAATLRTKRLVEGSWTIVGNSHSNARGNLPADSKCKPSMICSNPTRILQKVKTTLDPENCPQYQATEAIQQWREEVNNASAITSSGSSEDSSHRTSIHTPTLVTETLDLLGDISIADDVFLDQVLRGTQHLGTPVTDIGDLISFDETHERNYQEKLSRQDKSPLLGLSEVPVYAPPPNSGIPMSPRATMTPRQSLRGFKKGPSRTCLNGHPHPSMFCDTGLEIKNRVGILQLLPGEVSIRLTFGKVFLKRFPSNLVDLENQLQYPKERILQFLSSIPKECIGFTPVLSTQESDAVALPAIKFFGMSEWTLAEPKVYYDFVCEFGQSVTDCCTLELDPQTGASMRSRQTEVFSAFLHCPSSNWDMKVSGRHSVDTAHRYRTWLDKWLGSVKISTIGQDRLRLEFNDCHRNSAAVKAVEARHVFRYGDRSGDYILEVVLRMKLYKAGKKKAKDANGLDWVAWEMPKTWQSAKGGPDQWIEASLLSNLTEKLFASNLGMKFGSRAAWSPNDLEDGRVFADLCQQGFSMVSQMDEFGIHNNNVEAFNIPSVYTDSTEAHERRETMYFW